MSCQTCKQPSCQTPNACYEARLSLGFSTDKTMIVGKLDGVPIIPLRLPAVIHANETNTNLKYDTKNKTLVFENEKYKNKNGSADSIPVAQLLAGANLNQLDGVAALSNGGLASVAVVDNVLTLIFEVPEPVQANELPGGFVAYVPDPIDGGSRYKIIKPAPGGTTDSLLIGHPNGSIEFAVPLTSPLLVPVNTLTSNGVFSGAPAVSSGSWRYQAMGSTQVVTNTSGSQVEVELFFRYSMQVASGTRNGVYCRLVNGGSDFQTSFVEGVSNIKQEGYPGGTGRFRCLLAPNQKCQFEFGGFENAAGTMTLTIGQIDESGGVAVPPVITIRRQI